MSSHQWLGAVLIMQVLLCTFVSAESTVSSDTKPTTHVQVACYDKGQVYIDGETFASNSTSFQPQKPNQCIQCVCQNGRILCRLKTCPGHSCQNPLYNRNDCCPVCPVVRPEQQDISEDNLLVTFQTSGGGTTCNSGRLSYPHGSTWHPVIGPLGQMDCVICKCQMGKIECGRVTCSSEALTCDKPQKVIGHCCPLCVNKDDQVPPVVGSVQSGFSVGEMPQNKKLCVSKRRNYIVFKNRAFIVKSGYYQFAFLKLKDRGNIRLLSWATKEDEMGDFSEQHLTQSEFSEVQKTFKFKLLGSTKSKLVERFIKRFKKLAERCKKRCDGKIPRLENGLRLQKVEQSSQCVGQNIPFEK
ncbi:chordin-like protein 1 isoform X1 [Limulus polyphemus]|uniref:Chordin-like protein 1 isoform X1 n=1 Tax=Limulus polyphemus TaxID=6850 RepID=A0ABM1SRH7_LIMPO|nr:chordin-like protein 1 isoform X1 [Limulus polyphemus]XP_022246233.1 chordin-like protein 1 isoform X1 [Limulus polyphemus]XP_022246234.1 chordin-like protein 1 isoform X1 [Limulus polyphemus]